MIQSNVPLDDTEFGIHLYNNTNTNMNTNTGNYPLLSPIKLRRNVEMYQWEEHEHSETEKNTGGSTTTKTTYTYTKDWYDTINAEQLQAIDKAISSSPYVIKLLEDGKKLQAKTKKAKV